MFTMLADAGISDVMSRAQQEFSMKVVAASYSQMQSATNESVVDKKHIMVFSGERENAAKFAECIKARESLAEQNGLWLSVCVSHRHSTKYPGSTVCIVLVNQG